MRKKVSCRVIESVPLHQNEDGLIRACPPCSTEPKISVFNGYSPPELPAMVRIYMDPVPATGMLDFWA